MFIGIFFKLSLLILKSKFWQNGHKRLRVKSDVSDVTVWFFTSQFMDFFLILNIRTQVIIDNFIYIHIYIRAVKFGEKIGQKFNH